jgi:hypothetical protein
MSLDLFKSWLQEHNAAFCKANIVLTENAGFGATVAADVDPDEAVMAIPRKLLMNYSAAVRSATVGAAVQSLQHTCGFDFPNDADRERGT